MASKAMVRDEIDILYAASNQPTQASTPLQQLEAISDYAPENGAYSGPLFYIGTHISIRIPLQLN